MSSPALSLPWTGHENILTALQVINIKKKTTLTRFNIKTHGIPIPCVRKIKTKNLLRKLKQFDLFTMCFLLPYDLQPQQSFVHIRQKQSFSLSSSIFSLSNTYKENMLTETYGFYVIIDLSYPRPLINSYSWWNRSTNFSHAHSSRERKSVSA